MIVPHCDSTPSARSDGRCVIRPRLMPYLRPSLAMRLRMRPTLEPSAFFSFGHVAVRLFAHQQDRPGLLLAAPDGEVEHHPAEHRDHRRGDVRRHAGDVDDRDRLAAAGHAEDLGDELRHRVADQHAREHELVARIGLELVDLGLDAHERRAGRRLVELAHLVCMMLVRSREQIGDRRIDGDLAHLLGQPVLAARLEQALGENVGVLLPVVAGRGQEHLAMLLEVHQPVGHLQVGDVEDRAGVAERGGIFAVRVDHHDVALAARSRRSGAGSARRWSICRYRSSRAARNACRASHRRRCRRGCRWSDRRCRPGSRSARRRRRSACRSAVVAG